MIIDKRVERGIGETFLIVDDWYRVIPNLSANSSCSDCDAQSLCDTQMKENVIGNCSAQGRSDSCDVVMQRIGQDVGMERSQVEESVALESPFHDVLRVMGDLHDAKNHDYSPEGQFGNFAESEKIGVPAWKGAFVRLQDKYTRACNLIGGKEAQVVDEKLEDTLLDMANYAVIVLCLMRERSDR